MQVYRNAALAALGVMAATTESAAAYVGPGAGLSAIGSVLAFLGVIALMILGFFWYPVKRFLAGRRGGGPAEDSKGQDGQ